MKKIALLLSVLLVGCANNVDVKPNDPVIAPETKTVVIPKEQLTPCPDLTPPDLKALNQGETLTLLGSWFNTYVTCQLSHNGLIPTVTKAFNTK